MLVRPGFEPATSSSADRRSPNRANQVGFTCYLFFSPYNLVFYLNTFSNFSFLFQVRLWLRALRKICHHVPSTLTIGKRYIGPWRHYCADQSLPSFASTHYFCYFFFNSSGSYFNGFFVSGSASCYCQLWEESERFLGSSTECSQLKWNLQGCQERFPMQSLFDSNFISSF